MKRNITVVAATVDEATQIAHQLSDVLGSKTRIRTETFDTALQSSDRLPLVSGGSAQTTRVVAGPRGQRPDVIPIRYNLTKESWRTIMKAAKVLRGASVAVTGATADVAANVAETVKRLDIGGLRLQPVSIRTLSGRKFDFVLVADPFLETIAEQAGRVMKLGPLLLSPSVIANLLCRYGHYDEAAKAMLANYVENLKLVRDDYLGLLDIPHNEAPQIAPSVQAEHGRKPKPGSDTRYTLDDIIGQSLALKKAKGMVQQLSDSTASVVIQGETGTGKEMFAQAIHSTSPRADKPFVTVNCAAIPETLAESELFGYEEGSFTGARKGGKIGLFEYANGGTVFLDEVNDMSLEIQARLLRVLESHTLLRIGGRKSIDIDVRIIAASNKPLEEYVEGGRFREDLFFRLCVIPICLPTLRERVEDIPLLVRHVLAESGETRDLSQAAWEKLKRYSWPGNVRELKHCLEYMRTVTDNTKKLDVFPPHIGRNGISTGMNRSEARESVERDEQQSIQRFTERTIDKHEPVCWPVDSYLEEKDVFILAAIEHVNAVGHGIGRRCLAREAIRFGVPMSESEIRTRLSLLRTMGFVNWAAGRGGTKLSRSGYQVLTEQRNRFQFDRPIH